MDHRTEVFLVAATNGMIYVLWQKAKILLAMVKEKRRDDKARTGRIKAGHIRK